MSINGNALIPTERIAQSILLLRGQKVIIDADLAELYGVPTKALNQAVKRNQERFPEDFMFQLSAAEKAEVVTNCDHLANLKFAKTSPYAFTEHGAIQAANVLSSPRAVGMGVYVVRAFVRLREVYAKLDDKCRTVLDRFYFERKDLAAIADEMGVEEESIRTIKYRCMMKLRAVRNVIRGEENEAS